MASTRPAASSAAKARRRASTARLAVRLGTRRRWRTRWSLGDEDHRDARGGDGLKDAGRDARDAGHARAGDVHQGDAGQEGQAAGADPEERGAGVHEGCRAGPARSCCSTRTGMPLLAGRRMVFGWSTLAPK